MRNILAILLTLYPFLASAQGAPPVYGPGQIPGVAAGGAQVNGFWQKTGVARYPVTAAEQYPGASAGVQEPSLLAAKEGNCVLYSTATSCFKMTYTGGTGSFTILYSESLDGRVWHPAPITLLSNYRSGAFYKLTGAVTASMSSNTLTVISAAAGQVLSVGSTISGSGVTPVKLTALTGGSGGAGTTYTFAGAPQTVASTTITGTGYFEEAATATGTKIDLYSSATSGGTYALVKADIMPRGATQSWNAMAVYNSSVTNVSGVLYVLLEGETDAAGTVTSLGSYTAIAADPSTLTPNASNPVAARTNYTVADPSRIFQRQDGTWAFLYYCALNSGATVPSDTCMATAALPGAASWTLNSVPVFPRTTADEGVNMPNGQVADVDIMDYTDGGGNAKCLMLHAASTNGSPPTTTLAPLVGNLIIKGAYADMACGAVLATTQGVNAGSIASGEQPTSLQTEIQTTDVRVSGTQIAATGQYGWMDWFSQGVRFFSQGPDNSTRGQFDWYVQTANGASQSHAMNISVNGDTTIYRSLVAAFKFFGVVQTPASSNASCTTGELSSDTSYLYRCVATNTWLSAAWAPFQTAAALPTLPGTTSAIGGGALLAGACTSGTVAVTNSTTGMAVSVSPVTYPGDGIYWLGYVSTAGTVTVKVCGAVAATPTSSVYNVRVIQ